MKNKLDVALIVGMALCYSLGHLLPAESFVRLAGVLLQVFSLRLLASGIGWLHGR